MPTKSKPKLFMSTGHLTALGVTYYVDQELGARLRGRLSKHVVSCFRCLDRATEQARLFRLAAFALRPGPMKNRKGKP